MPEAPKPKLDVMEIFSPRYRMNTLIASIICAAQKHGVFRGRF